MMEGTDFLHSWKECYKDGELNIPALLATQKGVTWERDTDMGGEEGASHQYWIGKKDGVEVVHAYYLSGKRGESLRILPIDSSFYGNDA
jgi:hypothetical protein